MQASGQVQESLVACTDICYDAAMPEFQPAYLALYKSGELKNRVQEARQHEPHDEVHARPPSRLRAPPRRLPE